MWSESPCEQARGCRLRAILIACLGTALTAAQPSLAAAQADSAGPATGQLLVRVRRNDSTPIVGAFVRSERIAAITDTSGVASIELPATLRRVTVSARGLRERAFEMTIVAGASNRVDIFLSPAGPDDEATATGLRRDARVSDEAASVDVLSSEQMSDANTGHPTDLLPVLARVDGVYAQAVNGPLAANRLRLFGSPGDLTTILVDGVPLLGGYPGSFGLMQATPLEFSQIEVLRGAASAWFGPTAGLGVINLVSRRPDRNSARLQADQSSEKGGDIVFTGATRLSPTLGATVAADFHQQRLVDADEDNWGEFPRAIRFGLRPRLFLDRPNGDGMIVTAGVLSDDRTGGFLFNPNSGQDVYRETRSQQAANGSFIGWRGAPSAGRLQVKLALNAERVKYDYDGILQRHNRTSVFGELSYARALGPAAVVVGAAYQADAIYQRDLTGYDYSYTAPGLFATATVSHHLWTASVAARCDHHNEFGSQCGANAAVLFRPTGSLRLKLSAGSGGYAPNLYTEETETADLRGLAPGVVSAERITSGSGDLQWRRGPFELGATVNLDRIAGAVRAITVDTGPPATLVKLVNLPEPTRIAAVGLRVVYRRNPLTIRASYVRQWGTESDTSVGTARRDLDHLPTELATFDLGIRPRVGDTRVNLIARYVGPQALWDDPFRTRSNSYVVSDIVLSQRTGRARIYASGENLLDVKQGADEPVILPVPWLGRRRTTMPAKPLRGRVVSFGVALEW